MPTRLTTAQITPTGSTPQKHNKMFASQAALQSTQPVSASQWERAGNGQRSSTEGPLLARLHKAREGGREVLATPHTHTHTHTHACLLRDWRPVRPQKENFTCWCPDLASLGYRIQRQRFQTIVGRAPSGSVLSLKALIVFNFCKPPRELRLWGGI